MNEYVCTHVCVCVRVSVSVSVRACVCECLCHTEEYSDSPVQNDRVLHKSGESKRYKVEEGGGRREEKMRGNLTLWDGEDSRATTKRGEGNEKECE